MIWDKPKETILQQERDEGYLEAIFCPVESIEAYKRKYKSISPSAKNYRRMRARLEGFMQGLEKRERARQLFGKSKQKSREGFDDDLER